MNSGTEEKDASFVNFLLGDFQSKEEPSRFDISFLLDPGLLVPCSSGGKSIRPANACCCRPLYAAPTSHRV